MFTGLVQALGTVVRTEPDGHGGRRLRVAEPELARHLTPGESIAGNGVSLTLVDVRPGRVSVMLIPHTLAHTTLGVRDVGSAVNLEFDLLAKHVRKLMKKFAVDI